MADTITTCTDYHQAYLAEVDSSRKAMQKVHNLTNENQSLKAEIETLKAEIQKLNQSVTVSDIIDAFMKTVSDHNLEVVIKQDREY